MEGQAVKNSKFILTAVGVVGLLGTAFAGKYTGDLGVWVATMVCAYAGANAVITRQALQSGKDPNQV